MISKTLIFFGNLVVWFVGIGVLNLTNPIQRLCYLGPNFLTSLFSIYFS
jgi:hypothetical protein